jgi:hypothetical protein
VQLRGFSAGAIWLCGLLARPGLADEGAPQEDTCAAPSTTISGYRREVGHADGTTEAEARSAAQAKARALLYGQLCPGEPSPTSPACRELSAQIETWLGYVTERRADGVSACATAVVRSSVVASMMGTMTRYLDDLQEVARTVVGLAAERPLVVELPRLHTGCPVGAEGAIVMAEAQRALASTGVAHVVSPSEATASALRLRTTLTPDEGGGLLLSMELYLPAERRSHLLGGPTRPQGSASHRGVACQSDAALGISSGDRQGSTGLSIDLFLDEGDPTPDGLVCDGGEVRVEVRVSAAATVRLYAVEPDGTTFLVWPPAAQDGEVAAGRTVLLTRLDAAAGSAGDDRFVAVAMPAGQAFDETLDWGGFCRSPYPMSDPRLRPAGAAWDDAAFRVLTGDAPQCERVTPQGGSRGYYEPPKCGEAR